MLNSLRPPPESCVDRFQDLQLYLPQLQHYKQTSSSFDEWIDATRKKQDALQATKIDNVQTLKDNINNQKVRCSALGLLSISLLTLLSVYFHLTNLDIVAFQGTEHGNQSEEGDIGQCAEGQRGLCDFCQGKDAGCVQHKQDFHFRI